MSGDSDLAALGSTAWAGWGMGEPHVLVESALERDPRKDRGSLSSWMPGAGLNHMSWGVDQTVCRSVLEHPERSCLSRAPRRRPDRPSSHKPAVGRASLQGTCWRQGLRGLTGLGRDRRRDRPLSHLGPCPPMLPIIQTPPTPQTLASTAPLWSLLPRPPSPQQPAVCF